MRASSPDESALPDAKLAAGFLVGCAGDELLEHITLPRRKRVEAVAFHRPLGRDRLGSVQ